MKAAFSTLSLFAVLATLNLAIAQPGNLPTARGSMPSGDAGVDYNLVDSSGEKDGLWIRVWPSGSLYYKGEFEAGKPVGKFLYFYDTGKLMSSVEHKGKTIASIHYRPNGSVQASGHYNSAPVGEEPTKTGSWGYYDETSLQRRSESYVAGVMHGEYWVKDYKGKLVEEGTFNIGEKDGKWTSYYESGKISEVITYASGELHGEFSSYHPNGNVRISGVYNDGSEDGSWKTYHDTGEMEKIIKYSMGTKVKDILINGVFEKTFPDGRSMSEYTYRDKLLDGPYRIWYDLGEYVIEPFIDEETGAQLQRQVLIGTQIKEEGEYVNGKLDGPCYKYREDGKILSKENYDNGELVE